MGLSGTTNSRVEVFDEYGFLTWIKDECGFLTRIKTDQPSGGLLQRIDDGNTGCIEDDPPVPDGWTTPEGGGLHLITDFEPDDLGRAKVALGPEHDIDLDEPNTTVRRVQQTLYRDELPAIWQAAGYATGTTGCGTKK